MSDYDASDGIILIFLFILTIFYISIFNKNLEDTYMYYLVFMTPFALYFIYKYCYILIDKLISNFTDNRIDLNKIEQIQHNNL